MPIGSIAPSKWSFATTKCGLPSLLTQHAKDINLLEAFNQHVYDFNKLQFDTHHLINATLIHGIHSDHSWLAAIADDPRFFYHAVAEASILGRTRGPQNHAQHCLHKSKVLFLTPAWKEAGHQPVQTTKLDKAKFALANSIGTSYRNLVATQFEHRLRKRCAQEVQRRLPCSSGKLRNAITVQVCCLVCCACLYM